MARVYTLPPIPGVKDLNTLMAFLMDKDTYDARLQSLVSLEEEINALVEKVGIAEEIEPMHKQAQALVQEAVTKLTEAAAEKERAASVKDEANLYAAKVRADMEAVKADARVQMDALQKHKEEVAQTHADQAALFKDWEGKLQEREEAAKKSHIKAQSLITAYNEKLSKLKSLAEGA